MDENEYSCKYFMSPQKGVSVEDKEPKQAKPVNIIKKT